MIECLRSLAAMTPFIGQRTQTRRPYRRTPTYFNLEDRTVPVAAAVVPLQSLLHGASALAMAGNMSTTSAISNCGSSAGATGSSGSNTSTMASADLQFLQHAAGGDMQEMILGGLAARLGSSAGVRNFGHTLLRDHATLLGNVLPILQHAGDISPSLDSDMRQHILQLASLRGSAFDQAFVNYMVQDHQSDIAETQSEISSGTNQAARAYAAASLPFLQRHLSIAQNLQGQVSGNSNGGSSNNGSSSSSSSGGDNNGSSSSSNSNGSSSSGSSSSSTGSGRDSTFLSQAAQSDMQDLLFGGLAARFSNNGSVRNFGRQLVRDSSDALANLSTVLVAEGQSLPDISDDQGAYLTMLTSMHGREFNQTFVSLSVLNQQMNVIRYQNEIQSGTDSAAQAYATSTLSNLQAQLAAAEKLSGKHGFCIGPGGGSQGETDSSSSQGSSSNYNCGSSCSSGQGGSSQGSSSANNGGSFCSSGQGGSQGSSGDNNGRSSCSSGQGGSQGSSSNNNGGSSCSSGQGQGGNQGGSSHAKNHGDDDDSSSQGQAGGSNANTQCAGGNSSHGNSESHDDDDKGHGHGDQDHSHGRHAA
jgi:putative membrane protein